MDENVERVRRLIRQFGRNVALVVNHSGGKDSTRMLGLVRGIFPHCTLGDHPKAATYDQFKTGHSEGLRHTH